MSQGSNYKAQVMEALSNAPTNLITNKAFLWAASNLPDEGGVGTFAKTAKKPMTHSPDIDFWEAIGYSRDWADKTVKEKLVKVFEDIARRQYDANPKSADFSRSRIFEELLKSEDPELMFFMLAAGFISCYDSVRRNMSPEFQESIDMGGSPGDLLEKIKRSIEAGRNLEDLSLKAGSSEATASEMRSEADIPEDAPEQVKALLRALIELKRNLGGLRP